MTTPMIKFQALLRELFQFDYADLDFGIYRIMNYKRDVIEKFITQDLPKAIAEELDRGALADQSQAAKELVEVAQQIKETLGRDAVDADGNLNEAFHETPLGKKYQDLKPKVADARGRKAFEANIFNHLYAFFSRYYQDGDFISKRRYSKRQRYAIPYNGEEVYLYWANSDQYYIKTAEHFTDYTYNAPNGVTVHFKLKAADVEQNNVKGDKRFLMLRLNEIAWDEGAGELVIPFEYRPLTEQEAISYGKSKQQDKIITDTLEAIPKKIAKNLRALAALSAEKRQGAKGNPVSYIEHHLQQYTRRSTSDFFIHKGLEGFLSRELDFYLKNEVLNLQEMETAGEDLTESWFQMMRLIKLVGNYIIDFLAQIENFQKMLWEKRKFVTETFYCISVGYIPEDFYPEIAACKPQWEEWKALFDIDDPKTLEDRLDFVKARPTLVLDTRHFTRDFVDRLLINFDDLDQMTDGLLMHSENWQALNLLMEKYRERVKCAYIDPPYNTGSDGFQYKDTYLHSSWLTMLRDRIEIGSRLLSVSGALFVSVDDHEQYYLRSLLSDILGEENFLANIVWHKMDSPKNTAMHFSEDHDYITAYAISGKSWRPNLLPRSEKMLSRYKNPDNDLRGPWLLSDLAARNYYAEGRYSITTPSGRRIEGPPAGSYWRVSREKFDKLDRDGRIWWGQTGVSRPGIKRFLSEVQDGVVPQTYWPWKDVGSTRNAKRELANIMVRDIGDELFITPKPSRLVNRILLIGSAVESYAMDYFAGSGTTGHAVINLNREDGGRRKFILVEMGEYFDTVLLPRIKKVTFTPEWKDGRPKRMATQEEAERSPRIIKVIRLESYEDALNNIAFEEESGQRALKFEDYLLRYMLNWETRASETLLNVEKLARPFSYKLHIHGDGQTRNTVADIPETFNYLLGLHVQTRKVYDDSGRRYLVYRGRTREGRQVAVIWRETEGWAKADLDRDKQFVADRKIAEGADEVFVNGDSFIPNAKALDPILKARMFAPVEA